MIRKFVSFSERPGVAAALGRELLDFTGILFEYWHAYRAGKLPHATFLTWMSALGPKMEAVLARGAAAGIEGVSGSCADILEHKPALWTFTVHVRSSYLLLASGGIKSDVIDALCEGRPSILGTEAAVLEVEGGAVRAELVGEHIADSVPDGALHVRRAGRCPGWTRDVNVTVWLACDGGLDSPDAARAACARRLKDGAVSGSTTHTSGRSLSDHAAIRDAIERHGLKSEGPVVILETWAATGKPAAPRETL